MHVHVYVYMHTTKKTYVFMCPLSLVLGRCGLHQAFQIWYTHIIQACQTCQSATVLLYNVWVRACVRVGVRRVRVCVFVGEYNLDARAAEQANYQHSKNCTILIAKFVGNIVACALLRDSNLPLCDCDMVQMHLSMRPKQTGVFSKRVERSVVKVGMWDCLLDCDSSGLLLRVRPTTEFRVVCNCRSDL